MSTSSSTDNNTYKVFQITDTLRHKKGYTIYKVVCKEISKITTETESEIIIWKRYNDFKKLHKALHALHRNFYLKRKFPEFAKAKFFGRFEADVLAERKKSALELLEYTNCYPILSTSPEFISFFEDGQKQVFDSTKFPISSNMEPVPDTYSIASSDQVNFKNERLPEFPQEAEHGKLLGGVWNYRKPADDISFNSDEEISDDDRTTFTDSDSVLSTPQPNLDFSFFDPLQDESYISRDISDRNFSSFSEELLSRTNSSASATETQMFNFPDVLSDVINSEKLMENYNSLKIIPSDAENRKTIVDLKEFDPFSGENEDVTDAGDSKSVQPLSPLTPTVGGIAADIQQYLCDAASVISLAQQHEVNQNYEKAFQYYKLGIDKLLCGVQKETNTLRRDAVRKKISQYLQKADDLYFGHIAEDPENDRIWNDVNTNGTSNSLNALRTELQRYKVLGIIDKVTLVLDTINQNTYVMKTLYKSPNPATNSRPSIVPTQIPFMTKLYKVHDTDYALYLVLEHASGGRLWSYVSQFIQTSPCSPSRELHCPTRKLISPLKEDHSQAKSAANVYSGKQFLHSDAIDGPKTSTNCKSDNYASAEMYQDILEVTLDADLCAEAEYPSSYVQLFTNISSNLEASGNSAKILSSEIINDKNIDNSTKNLASDEIIKNSVSSSNLSVSPSQIVVDESKTPETSKDYSFHNDQTARSKTLSDADYLISNARELLANVGHTLEKSRTDVTHVPNKNENTSYSEEVTNEDKKTCDIKPVKPRSLSLTPSSQNKRRSSFKVHEPFSSPNDTPVRRRHCSSSYGGSLENLSHTHSRGAAMIFKQFNELDESVAVYLPEKCVKSWAAEIGMAIAHLHVMGISCRDLKPDNILLGEGGHIRLSYFSQWNCIENQVDREAVENLYCAPELDGVQPVTKSADWWSLGVLLYELLTGRTLVSCHPGGITSHTQLFLPNHLSEEGKSILNQLLKVNPAERLGSGISGFEEIKSHPFFLNIDWKALSSS